MEHNSFLRSNSKRKPPFERLSTESPVASHYFPSKGFRTQENVATRSDLEDEFNEKIATLKHFYQIRIRSFEDSLATFYQRIFDDELMKTLRKDAISADFVHERVRELLHEILNNDTEILLTNVTAQYANLKQELKRVESEKSEVLSQSTSEINALNARLEQLSQELTVESKFKEELMLENAGLKSRCDELASRFNRESLVVEDERQRLFANRSLELQEVLREKSRKEEDLNRISMINLDLHKNLQLFKQEKEDLLRKNRELEARSKGLEDEGSRVKKKAEELESKVAELKEKLARRNSEIQALRFEKKQEFDQSFKLEKENLLKYEEFHQMLSVMEEKFESQKKHHKAKKRKLKEKALKYKKTLEKQSQSYLETSSKLEKDVKRLEAERLALLSQKSDLELASEDLKKKHLISMAEMAQKHEDALDQVQRKFSRHLDLALDKLRTDHAEEVSELRGELERSKRLQEELFSDHSANYLQKKEHFRVVEDLEQLVEELKREIEDKTVGFHREILEKQRFFEEKFQKDLEIIQKSANRLNLQSFFPFIIMRVVFIEKLGFFEEKLKEEQESKQELVLQVTKLEEVYKKALREKALSEQELLNLKSLEKPVSLPKPESLPPRVESPDKELVEKLSLKLEDLKGQVQILTEKNAKSLKEISGLKRRLEESGEESARLGENLSSARKRNDSLAEELLEVRNRGVLQEKSANNTINHLKSENSALQQEAEALKSRLSEVQQRNSELSQKHSESLLENRAEMHGLRASSKDLAVLEGKLREKMEEISIKDVKIAKFEKALRGVEEELSGRSAEVQALQTERKETRAKIMKWKRLMQENKEKLYRSVQRKLEVLRKDSNELKLFLRKALKLAQNDLSIQAHFAGEVLQNTLRRREEAVRAELEKARESHRSSMGREMNDREAEARELKARILEAGNARRQLESEVQTLLTENSRMKAEISIFNEKRPESLAEIDRMRVENARISGEIARYQGESSRLQAEVATLQDKLNMAQIKGDKNEENRRLLNELMQLRAAIDTLYTKHKQILDEVTQDIERLKEKQSEEISHINQNYTEMINVMTEKLENLKRDDTNKSSNLLKMSQRIDYLEKAKQQLENRLNYSAELLQTNTIIENPVKSYESPSLKSGRNVPPTIENSRLLANKSEGDLEKLYEHFESKEKSEILDPLNYYGGGSNNKNIYYSSISRDTDENPNNMINNNSKEGTQSLLNEETNTNKRIKQFTTFDPLLDKDKKLSINKEQQEVDDLKDLLYKRVEDNNQTKKKFNEEADNLQDKIKELQKMHEFLGASSMIKKSGNWSVVLGGGHKSTKSNDSPDFPNYPEKLAQLYSPISVKPSLERDENLKL